MRLFFGIPVQDALINEAKNCIFERQSSFLKEGRWVKLGDAHITLAFLPNFPEAILPSLIKKAENLLAGEHPFQIALKSICFFPDPNASKFLVIACEKNTVIENLFQQFKALLKSLDSSYKDAHQFLPHITLCRFPIRSETQFAPISISNRYISVDTINLYQSHPTGESSYYSIRQQFYLNKR